ncbi:MFS gliotoxin efflux transporter glia [Halenospora varia]|nr:MFS gliotoxin efflux transporter glia [Halenospora varia]
MEMTGNVQGCHSTSSVPRKECSKVLVESIVAESNVEQQTNGEYPGWYQLLFILVALILGMFLVSLDMTIVATAIPKITDKFHSIDQVGWYGSAFFLALAAFQSTWGKAYKYFPLKSAFLLTIAIFEIGSLICGVAQNSTTLIVGRAVAGIGGAGIASGIYTIIAFTAKPNQRPAFTGILGAVYGVASVIGPLLGGLLTDNLSWRWCFYINLPIGGASAAIILIFFRTPRAATPMKAELKEKFLQMDFLGTLTIMAAGICYVLAMQWGGVTKAWNSPAVVGTLIGFGLIVSAFVVLEWRLCERAMILFRLLRVQTIATGSVFAFFLFGAFFTLMYYVPLYFQAVSGVSAAQSGIRNLPLVLAVSIFTILSGALITMFGYFMPFLVGGAALTTIGAGLLFTMDIGSNPAQWIGYQALAGIGIGLSIQVPIICAQAVVAPSDISSATAMILFFETIGGAFIVSAGQSAFANTLIKNLPFTAPGVESGQVIRTGAAELRNKFSITVLPGVIQAYMDGLQIVFAVAIASAGIATLASVFSERGTLKQLQKANPAIPEG